MKMFLVTLSVLFLFPFGVGATTLSPDSPATLFMSWSPGQLNAGEFDLNWTLSKGTFGSKFERLDFGTVETWLHDGEPMNFSLEIDTVTGVLNFVFGDRLFGPQETGFTTHLSLVPAGFRTRSESLGIVNIVKPTNLNTNDFGPKVPTPEPAKDFMYAFSEGANTVTGSVGTGDTFKFDFFITDQPTTTAVVPEPGTSVMMFLGLLVLTLATPRK